MVCRFRHHVLVRLQQIVDGHAIAVGVLARTIDMPLKIDCLLVVGQNLRDDDVVPSLHLEAGDLLFY